MFADFFEVLWLGVGYGPRCRQLFDTGFEPVTGEGGLGCGAGLCWQRLQVQVGGSAREHCAAGAGEVTELSSVSGSGVRTLLRRLITVIDEDRAAEAPKQEPVPWSP